MRDTRFKARIGWRGRNSGVALVGSARVAPLVNSVGYERIGYSFTPSFTGAYDDVSGPGLYSALDFQVTRGRADRWSNVIAGECSLTLHDKGDGRYNPVNPASSLYGLIRPMRPVRISAVLEDGVTEEDLFWGWLDESADNPEIGTQRATFNFKDLLMWLDSDNPVIPATGPITVGAAIGLILDWFSWTNPATRSLQTGMLLPNFEATGDKSGLALIGEMLTVDLGMFFHSRKNVATYIDRYEYARRASIGEFTASTAVIPGVKLANVKNRQAVEYDDGINPPLEQTVEDAGSRHEFGPRAWGKVSSPYFGSDAVALTFAQYRVAQAKEPVAPVWTYRVSEGFTGDFDKIAKMDLVDRLTITAPTCRDYHVEKLVHKGEAGVLFQSDLTLSERPANLPALVGRAKVAPAIDSAGYDRVAY